MRRAVFFDRDGVLNELVLRDGHGASPRRASDFQVTRGAAELVHRLRQAGLSIFVVTNQPDVARGYVPAAELDAMHVLLKKTLAPDDIAVCPHDDSDRCSCRKPQPGMLHTLATRWSIDLGASVVVGDSWRDVEAGWRAGCRTVLLVPAGAPSETRAPRVTASVIVSTLDEAGDWILTHLADQRRVGP